MNEITEGLKTFTLFDFILIFLILLMLYVTFTNAWR